MFTAIDINTNEFQSTLSMRRATAPMLFDSSVLNISIHALHEESDHEFIYLRRTDVISIHALHEESDSPRSVRHWWKPIFQSTLSMRRATRQ